MLIFWRLWRTIFLVKKEDMSFKRRTYGNPTYLSLNLVEDLQGRPFFSKAYFEVQQHTVLQNRATELLGTITEGNVNFCTITLTSNPIFTSY